MGKSDRQYRLCHDLRFKLVKSRQSADAGEGRTVSIGSREVVFEASWQLPMGALIELSIAWPALLNGGCPMQLIVLGRIIDAENGLVKCAVLKYEFRTRARREPAVCLSAVTSDDRLGRTSPAS